MRTVPSSEAVATTAAAAAAPLAEAGHTATALITSACASRMDIWHSARQSLRSKDESSRSPPRSPCGAPPLAVFCRFTIENLPYLDYM
jgi:hypothetical protein